MKNKLIYKIGWMLILLPLFAGCNDADDVAAIFTGKTWKLNYITTDEGNTMFPFWETDTQERQSIEELNRLGSYNVTFTITLTEGDIVKGKIEGTLINGGNLSGIWSANGKNNDFQATITTGNPGNDFLARNFLEGLKNATSYTGDSKNLFIIYKPKSSEQKMRIAFRVLNKK